MKNTVHYLCIAQNQNGFVFPDELPDDYYSLGFFVIEASEDRQLAESYLFRYVLREKVHESHLIKIDSRRFKIGIQDVNSFEFDLFPVHYRYNQYVGSRGSMQKHGRLWFLRCKQERALEKACKQHGFFFIGSIDEE